MSVCRTSVSSSMDRFNAGSRGQGAGLAKSRGRSAHSGTWQVPLLEVLPAWILGFLCVRGRFLHGRGKFLCARGRFLHGGEKVLFARGRFLHGGGKVLCARERFLHGGEKVLFVRGRFLHGGGKVLCVSERFLHGRGKVLCVSERFLHGGGKVLCLRGKPPDRRCPGVFLTPAWTARPPSPFP